MGKLFSFPTKNFRNTISHFPAKCKKIPSPTREDGKNQLPNVLNNNAAVGLHAGGMGGDVLHILQRCMDHMALISVHGLQGGAAAGFQNLLGLLAGVAAEALLDRKSVV